MVNLIATVVSVVLTVAMITAEMPYLGSVFTSAGAKASAMIITSGFSQIAAAWNMYTVQSYTTATGAIGSTSPTLTGAGANDLVALNLLSAVPTAPSTSTSWGSVATALLPAGFYLDLTNPATATGLTGGGAFTVDANGGIFTVLSSTAGSTCLQIAQAGGMTIVGGVPTSVATVTNFYNAFLGVRYGCVQAGTATGLTIANSTGIAGDNGKYIAYFKN